MTNEELMAQHSYGIIDDWSDLVRRIKENNAILKKPDDIPNNGGNTPRIYRNNKFQDRIQNSKPTRNPSKY